MILSGFNISTPSMDLKFTFESDNAVQKAIAFKSFLEEERLDGIENLQIEQTQGKPGDQGLGTFLGSLWATLTGNSETVKKLIDVIDRFVGMFDGRLVVEDGAGGKLVIPGGKKLTPEQKENIAVEFLKRK
jgi:hypothetical protein